MKYPTVETVRNFYANYNYGLQLEQQMNMELFMHPNISQTTVHIEETVTAIEAELGNRLPTSWARMTSKVTRQQNFNGQPNHFLPSTIQRNIIPLYDDWLHKNGPDLMVDFRTAMYGEPREDIVVSDFDADDNEIPEDMYMHDND